MAVPKTIRVRGEAGFSMLELVIVVAIIIIMAAIAVPRFTPTVGLYRARAAAVSVADLMQQGRIAAIRADSFYSVKYTTGSDGTYRLWVDENADGNVDTTEPQVGLSSGISFITSPPTSLTSTQVGGFTPNVGGSSSTNWVAWSSRGLPCVPNSGGTTCAITPSSGTTGYVYYIKVNSIGSTSQYSAVTITPSGRVRVWIYDGTNWH
jgi:Tfp pilus assembly protein FimT